VVPLSQRRGKNAERERPQNRLELPALGRSFSATRFGSRSEVWKRDVERLGGPPVSIALVVAEFTA